MIEARKDSAVLVQDHYDFVNTVVGEDIGHHQTFRNLTTAILFHIPNVPPGGLKQSMINRKNKLDANDLIEAAITPNELLIDSLVYVVFQALRELHADAIDEIISNPPTMPGTQRQKVTPPTDIIPLPAMQANSGRLDAFFKAQEIMMQRFLGIKDNDESWKTRIWITVSDQKTAQYARTLALHNRSSKNHYARRNWQVAPPALWHTQLNLLRLIPSTHLKTPGSSDATIEADAEYFHMRRPSDAEHAEFKPTKRLVKRAFTARICAMLYNEMFESGLIRKPGQQNEIELNQINTIIKRKGRGWLMKFVKKEATMLSSPEIWLDNISGEMKGDKEFVSMRRLMAESAYYFILDSAVRGGHNDVIKNLLPTLAVLFYGAKRNLYGYEMLKLHWYLHPDTSEPPLQDGILAASLVPQKHDGDKFMGTDLSLEIHNWFLKASMNEKKNSTHTFIHTSDRVGALGGTVNRIKSGIENAFGSTRSNAKHTESHNKQAIFGRAISLNLAGRMTPTELNSESGWLSPNIFAIGCGIIHTKIDKFNNDEEYGTVAREEGVAEEDDDGIGGGDRYVEDDFDFDFDMDDDHF
jgi:hypothetical protein